MNLTGINGTTYTLDQKPIGSGGEGDVFHAHIITTRIAKIYKPGVLAQELENKLKIMIEHPPDKSVLSQVAWPLDLIYSDNTQCKGFIMSELSINAELSEIYKYPSTLPISVHQKINIAQNICVVISEVHKSGYVFGDFNPRNIGLDVNTGLVSFLDTDSYHVVDPINGNTYRCNVCAPGYAAPELLEKCADYVAENPSASKNAYSQTPLPTFTQETDNFALAIHIFKLLMNGYTPFGGIIETASVSQSSPGVGDMAVRRDSYCFKPGYKHQSAAIPALDAFPNEISDLFSRAFIAGRQDPGQRPSAVEWHLALSKYAESLVTCLANPLHQYDSKNDLCPYCEADRRFGAAVSGEALPTSKLKQTAYAPPPPDAAPRQAAAQPVKRIKTTTANASKKAGTSSVKAIIRNTLSAGAEHSVAIATDGSLYAWGANTYGQIGDGSYYRSLTPINVISNVVAVSAGDAHTMAITADGVLWGWGNNEFGQLGDGTYESRSSLVKILTDVVAVSAGDAHTIATTANGVLWGWGNNDYGQIGDSTFVHRRDPVMIMDNVKSIAAGFNASAAVTEDGRLFEWGETFFSSQLVNDASKYLHTPMQVISDAIAVSYCYDHTMAITTDGGLWAWGLNADGQLGDGSDIGRSHPVRVMDKVVKVSAGGSHTLAITANGILWAWGLNNYGQLGNGTKKNQYAPTKIMENAVAISAGDVHSMAIRADGTLWAWGYNKNGRLGDGSTRNSKSPVMILENMMIP